MDFPDAGRQGIAQFSARWVAHGGWIWRAACGLALTWASAITWAAGPIALFESAPASVAPDKHAPQEKVIQAISARPATQAKGGGKGVPILRQRMLTLPAPRIEDVHRAFESNGSARVRMAFFADADHDVTFHRSEPTLSGGRVYVGRVDSDPLGIAVMVVNPQAFAINVTANRRHFFVRGTPDASGMSTALAAEHAENTLPDHDRPLPDPQAALRRASAEDAHHGHSKKGERAQRETPAIAPSPTALNRKLTEPAAGSATPLTDDGTQMDVMVVYTQAARAAAGGTAQMQADIDAQFALTNQVYANSGVVQRLRLVYRGEVTHTEGDPGADLDRVQTPNDNILDDVPVLRNVYQADFVSLWGIYPSLCGVAYPLVSEQAGFAPLAYSVVNSPACTVGNQYTFAHELGHNMGLDHDLYVTSSVWRETPEGSTVLQDIPYMHGYVDTVNRFRTVMAYANQCSDLGFACARIPFFSNPNLNFLNSAFGGAVSAPVGNAANAHAARALNNTRETTANFRQGIANFNVPGLVPMLPPVATVTESAGSVTLTVSRHAGSSGAVSVDFTTADGTATAGTDYVATAGTLTWAHGDSAPKSIVIPVLTDAALEGTETFLVNFSNPTGGVFIGTQGGVAGSITVRITDESPDTFPPGGVVPSHYVNDAAPMAWDVDVSDGYQTPTSLRSAKVLGPSQTQQTYAYSKLNVTDTFIAGNVTFAYKVSSGVLGPTVFGNLDFLIDDVVVFTSAGGETGWQTASVPITAGLHKLTWQFKNRYNLDCSVIASPVCQDRAWIDQVVLPLPNPQLTVLKDGTGAGTVNGPGISCGVDCTSGLAAGTVVTLTATPNAGSVFAGWSGGGCSGNGACTLTLNANTAVTARFTPPPEAFPPGCAMPLGWNAPAGATAGWSVATDRVKTGACSLKSQAIGHAPAAGQANATKAQIQTSGDFLGGTLSFAYNVSSESGFDCLRLLIDGMQQSALGACSGVGGNGGSGASGETGWVNVSVPVGAGNHTILWSYEKNQSGTAGQDAAWIDDVVLPSRVPSLLTVALAGTGSGSVAGGSIFCGMSCSQSLEPGASVSLNAVPDVGSVFAGWSGGGCSGTGNCVVSIAAATTVTATFTRTHVQVTVALAGTGTGSVASSPAGINTATAQFSALFPIGNALTLAAAPGVNSTFAGWSGGGCSGTGACTLMPMANVTITATINQIPLPPGAPTLLSIVQGNGQLTLLFLPSATDNGSPITGYVGQCNAVIQSGTPPSITVTGLSNGTNYLCRVGATNANGTTYANASAPLLLTGSQSPAAIDAYSGHTHGAVGLVERRMQLGIAATHGAITIEPRRSNSATVRIVLNVNVTSLAGVDVQNTSGTSVGSASASFAGNTVTVSLTNVPEALRAQIVLQQVNGGPNVAVPIGFLVGDLSLTGRVSAADIATLKARGTQPAAAGTAMLDINADGLINALDLSLVRSRTGRALP